MRHFEQLQEPEVGEDMRSQKTRSLVEHFLSCEQFYYVLLFLHIPSFFLHVVFTLPVL